MLSFLDLLMLLAAGALLGYWLSGMRARELARAAGLRACRAADVQFLDDTVLLRRVRLTRDAGARLVFVREYDFEFATEGDVRHRATVTVTGRSAMAPILQWPQ